ncbi:MAG: hypothetical protein Q4F63_05730 [Clostridia bacterium]|nr:hypothetical protein [Clostridia bacterium]
MLDKNELKVQLLNIIDRNEIEGAVISSPLKKSSDITKIKIEPVMLKGKLKYRFAYYEGQKVIHKIDRENVFDKIIAVMEEGFKQCSITANKHCTVLMNKKRLFSLTVVK